MGSLPSFPTQDELLHPRYGVGYILSDGSVGVYFNDSTKIILAAGSVFANMTPLKMNSRTLTTTGAAIEE